MPLIREGQEPTRHALRLQRRKCGKALGDGTPVVLVAVDDDGGRRVLPVPQQLRPRGIPFLQPGWVGPRVRLAAIAAVVDEEVGRENRGGDVEDAVMPDSADELVSSAVRHQIVVFGRRTFLAISWPKIQLTR